MTKHSSPDGPGGAKGKRVLVTGAGSGIGQGIARQLAAAGWHVAINDIDVGDAESVAAEIDGIAVPGDVGDEPAGIVEVAVDALGGLGFVANAGIHRRAPLSEVTAEQLDDVYSVNLRAVVLGGQAAVSAFGGHPGAIVATSSIAASTPQMGVGLYTAAKAGVSAFVAQAAVEWGPLGVRINAVAPGMVRTAMAEVVYSNEQLHERRRSMVPLGRIGKPEDIGDAVEFLLSPKASYITGQILTVDGGFTRTLVDLLPHPEDQID
ncbi:MAG: SDR family NAD(P)-dependent oxidoreductase [Microthrixaceae bacterium]